MPVINGVTMVGDFAGYAVLLSYPSEFQKRAPGSRCTKVFALAKIDDAEATAELYRQKDGYIVELLPLE